MMKHVEEMKEGEKFLLDGEEVTFLWEQRVMETQPCGCCSDYTDYWNVEYLEPSGEQTSIEIEYGEVEVPEQLK